MYCKGLTKEELLNYGIVEVRGNKYLETGIVTREGFKNKSKTIRERKQLVVGDVLARHKYTSDKSYPKISFSYKNKSIAITLSRIVYVWFIGDIPDNYVVDHIDNDPYNNKIGNLQLLSIGDNIRKRFNDLGCKCFNQFKNTEY